MPQFIKIIYQVNESSEALTHSCLHIPDARTRLLPTGANPTNIDRLSRTWSGWVLSFWVHMYSLRMLETCKRLLMSTHVSAVMDHVFDFHAGDISSKVYTHHSETCGMVHVRLRNQHVGLRPHVCTCRCGFHSAHLTLKITFCAKLFVNGETSYTQSKSW